MSTTVHTLESSPENARPLLEQAEQAFGFVPNLLGVMAESPALLEAYMSLGQLFSKSGFSATEQQVVLLTVSERNGCKYCLAAHRGIAKMQGVDTGVIEATAGGQPLDDGKLEALRRLTAEIVDSRGVPEAATVEQFFDADYDRAALFDVILGVGMKTLSNYTNHLAHTPIDEQFQE
jgi:AhpD family alkylhydroperoxidase